MHIIIQKLTSGWNLNAAIPTVNIVLKDLNTHWRRRQMKPDYFFIGWCHEDNHDKVWGAIKINDVDAFDSNYVSFWGRRGKKLQTKIYEDKSRYEMNVICGKKEAKGYKEIDFKKLNEVYPDFEKDLEKMAFWAQFKV